MERRAFVVWMTGLVVRPRPVSATATTRAWRIGVIGEGPRRLEPGTGLSGFIMGLRELGYVEGRNLTIEYRYAEMRSDRLPSFVTELVQLNLDLIAAAGTREAQLLKAATSTIPIVMLWPGDPVGAGLVSSLTRPGGNVTGTSVMFSDFDGKRLDLLRELVPKLRRVAIVWNPKNASTTRSMEAVADTAKALDLTIISIEADSAQRLEHGLAGMSKHRPDGILVLQDAVTVGYRRQIADVALRNGLATICPGRAYVESGGLLSYGPDLAAIGARAATYVDRILKGAKPAELPVEQPTKFELVINVKTAKALNLTIPPSLLLRADQVIE